MKRAAQTVSEPCGLTFAQLDRLTDEDLMVHLQAGHDDALAVIFERYHRLILSVALRILRDEGEAQDEVQAIFLEIYKVAGQFEASRGNTKIWLLQYAYHRSMNRRKYLQRRRFYDQTSEILPDIVDTACFVSGTGLLARLEVRNLVREGLESLNHAQRKTLEMSYFDGMTLREIADQTGESLDNVRHHYYRGLSRLRSLLLTTNRSGNGDMKATLVRRGVIDVGA